MKIALACLLLLLLPCGASAQDGVPSADALRARVERVENQRGHEAAEPALTHARRALSAAARSSAAGDAEAARRALNIADAALVLADRLAARERARRALAEARERKRTAHLRAQRAREALLRQIERRDAEDDG